jgi:hypothetical protein
MANMAQGDRFNRNSLMMGSAGRSRGKSVFSCQWKPVIGIRFSVFGKSSLVLGRWQERLSVFSKNWSAVDG